jgi:DNA-binding HxlR family transcriptional regulator
MKHKSFSHMNCSLAQTLEIVGERWTLLILRDAFFGSKRFGQFERSLGIVLTEEGILDKRDSDDGAHAIYVLTEKGLDLQPILISMTHWGDKYKANPTGDRLVFVDREQGEPIRRMSVIAQDGRALAPREIKAVPGPGLTDSEQIDVA